MIVVGGSKVLKVKDGMGKEASAAKSKAHSLEVRLKGLYVPI